MIVAYDACFDCGLRASGIFLASLIRFLFRIKGSILLFRMQQKNVFYKHVWSYPNQNTLNDIRELIEMGKIIPVVDRVFPFEEAINALKYLRKGRAKGKVIVNLKDD